MAEETKQAEMVEEVGTNEQVDTQETTEQPKEELIPKDVMKDRLDRKEKQHQKAYAELQENFNALKNEMEEIKLNSMPENERKSYKQTKAEKQQQERIKQLEERERRIQLQEATMQTKMELSDSGIDNRFVDILLDTGVHGTIEDKIAAFKDLYAEDLNQKVKQGVKQVLSGTAPKIGAIHNQAVTKEQFEQMGYSERVALKRENEELYNQLTK